MVGKLTFDERGFSNVLGIMLLMVVITLGVASVYVAGDAAVQDKANPAPEITSGQIAIYQDQVELTPLIGNQLEAEHTTVRVSFPDGGGDTVEIQNMDRAINQPGSNSIRVQAMSQGTIQQMDIDSTSTIGVRSSTTVQGIQTEMLRNDEPQDIQWDNGESLGIHVGSGDIQIGDRVRIEVIAGNGEERRSVLTKTVRVRQFPTVVTTGPGGSGPGAGGGGGGGGSGGGGPVAGPGDGSDEVSGGTGPGGAGDIGGGGVGPSDGSETIGAVPPGGFGPGSDDGSGSGGSGNGGGSGSGDSGWGSVGSGGGGGGGCFVSNEPNTYRGDGRGMHDGVCDVHGGFEGTEWINSEENIKGLVFEDEGELTDQYSTYSRNENGNIVVPTYVYNSELKDLYNKHREDADSTGGNYGGNNGGNSGGNNSGPSDEDKEDIKNSEDSDLDSCNNVPSSYC